MAYWVLGFGFWVPKKPSRHEPARVTRPAKLEAPRCREDTRNNTFEALSVSGLRFRLLKVSGPGRYPRCHSEMGGAKECQQE